MHASGTSTMARLCSSVLNHRARRQVEHRARLHRHSCISNLVTRWRYTPAFAILRPALDWLEISFLVALWSVITLHPVGGRGGKSSQSLGACPRRSVAYASRAVTTTDLGQSTCRATFVWGCACCAVSKGGAKGWPRSSTLAHGAPTEPPFEYFTHIAAIVPPPTPRWDPKVYAHTVHACSRTSDTGARSARTMSPSSSCGLHAVAVGAVKQTVAVIVYSVETLPSGLCGRVVASQLRPTHSEHTQRQSEQRICQPGHGAGRRPSRRPARPARTDPLRASNQIARSPAESERAGRAGAGAGGPRDCATVPPPRSAPAWSHQALRRARAATARRSAMRDLVCARPSRASPSASIRCVPSFLSARARMC